MAYTSGFSAVTGAVFTAAQYNTNVRDNFTAIWVYTTAGDISYATGATTLARLAIGAAGALLSSTGTAPAWQTNGRVHKIGTASTTTEKTTTSTAGVDIGGGLTLDLVTTLTCTVVLLIWGSVANDSSVHSTAVLGSIGGTNQTFDSTIPVSYTTAYTPYASFYMRTGLTAATITCKARLRTDNNGFTAFYKGGQILAIAITE